MKTIRILPISLLVLLALVISLCLPASPVAAAYSLPAGATITSATLELYVVEVYGPTGQPVRIHRIINDWNESTVTWNNFGGGYDPTVLAEFSPTAPGWQPPVDITAFVQGWVDGNYPNFGLLLEQQPTVPSTNFFLSYRSSEFATDTTLRPKVTICYTTPDTPETCFTIQRSATEYALADAFIYSYMPDESGGASQTLFTGRLSGKEKQSLIRFTLDITPPPPPATNPGTGTPGYWKNHSEAWPVEEITIGGIVYSKDQALSWMGSSNKHDKTITMFRALVAAKLNVLIGNDSSCIAETITNADNWFSAYGPVGSGVRANTSAWAQGEPLYTMLDDYNNGELCAPGRD